MTERSYNERRNQKVWVMVDRRGVAPKEVPAKLAAMGFALITYAAVRQILSRHRRCHNLSHQMSRP